MLQKQFPFCYSSSLDSVWRLLEDSFPKSQESFPPCIISKVEATAEKPESIVVQFALAGYNPKTIKVSVENDTLIVSAEKITQEAQVYPNLFASRAFTWQKTDVTGKLDLENAEPVWSDGLLQIGIPYKKPSQPKAKMLQVNIRS